MIRRDSSKGTSRPRHFILFCGSALLASGLPLSASADQTGAAATLVVSRIQYVAPTPAPDPFPQIFDDPNVSGGAEFATVLYLEGLFRQFENRRQLAAYAGLAPSPWKSGSIDQEQGISKAGNP